MAGGSDAPLSRLISANISGFRGLYADGTTRATGSDTLLTEAAFLRIVAEIVSVYSTRPVVVEIYRNILLLERCVPAAAPRRCAAPRSCSELLHVLLCRTAVLRCYVDALY